MKRQKTTLKQLGRLPWGRRFWQAGQLWLTTSVVNESGRPRERREMLQEAEPEGSPQALADVDVASPASGASAARAGA
jgi:hypothetical protein